jgi:23S rRNA (uracil1939-C5)-methyltransferase
MRTGDRLRLVIERPAVGGRMIARHDGAVVLVAGAIPGEVVEATIEKIQRGTVWASTARVLEASPDRAETAAGGACGGCVLAHVRYARQRALKAAMVADALGRIGHITLDQPLEVVASPPEGYRMRARLHVRGGRVGFFREGTHVLCDAGPTRQLRTDTLATLDALAAGLGAFPRAPVSEIELSENIEATERACHLELAPDADPSRLTAATRLGGLTGVSAAPVTSTRTRDLWGTPRVADTVTVTTGSSRHTVTLARHARAFFQANRYLLVPLVDYVLAEVEGGPVIDLFAGVGLFSVAAAAAGWGPITAVEGDHVAADDLRRNAAPFGDGLTVRVESVETFTAGAAKGRAAAATVIVDPPRTGLSREALAGTLSLGAPRLVYVSCDVATLARDARRLIEAGYRLVRARAFDLFPNTAHVEVIVSFARQRPG